MKIVCQLLLVALISEMAFAGPFPSKEVASGQTERCVKEYTLKAVCEILTKEAEKESRYQRALAARAKEVCLEYEKFTLSRRGFTGRYTGDTEVIDICPSVDIWRGETLEGPKEAQKIIEEINAGLVVMFNNLSKLRKNYVE